MQVFSEIAGLRAALDDHRRANRTLGFVPTMGALHEGHLSLVATARGENDVTVCSIYVNPTQFNDPKDLEKYPRNLERDQQMLEAAGCDYLFFPSNDTMYRKPPVVAMNFGALEEVMEGAYRPGHFKGVGLVVSKLLHIVQPSRAYFGQKDLQQFAIIRQMVEDLMFPVDLVRVPIVREANGLAMSSRNERLTPEERQQAGMLYESLRQAQAMLLEGTSVAETTRRIIDRFRAQNAIRLEYFEIAHSETLQPLSQIDSDTPVSLCIAAHLGTIRLIDNLSLTD